ncbi:GreA/GreB family elongation factor [[Mycobacterium] wendilense]|uniref:GreA/GreB family elongation factor n=1 Tax=[Mycobacterium] wendilense TaxID=3064284 RepID=A0ABN9NX44_9MYCO|nr:GreA/GreB family elongation factor [Mycolicibacterium sp. MU0050]CAJ1581781.1 GreA/GreB family elongation factor [Mycolicibacterium sp. MU0050]
MTTAQRIWLTPAAHEKLREELETLQRWTDDNDDSSDQNAEAVRRANQARIQEIHEILGNATVGEEPPNDGVAEPGMVLTIRYEGSDDTEEFLLGTRGADYGGIEVYSPSSPLGAAINGARVGDVRSYELPNGSSQEVTLLSAVPYGLHSS